MKKCVLSLCVLGLLVVGAVSADAAKWAGVKGGLNLGDLSGDDLDALVGDTDMRTGFSGGAFFGLGIGEQFGVQLEGLYVMKGAKEPGGDGKIKIDYIEFPLLFVADLPAGESFAFNVFAGPTFGFNIKSEFEDDGMTVDIKDDTKSFEFGAAVGGGFEYMLESFSIILDARYTIGATNVFEDDETTGTSIDIKNRGIGIMAGVSFPIGGE